MSVSILFPPRRHLNKMFSHFTTRVSTYTYLLPTTTMLAWHRRKRNKKNHIRCCLLLLTYGCNFHSVDMQKKTLMVERERERDFRKTRHFLRGFLEMTSLFLSFQFSPYSFSFFLSTSMNIECFLKSSNSSSSSSSSSSSFSPDSSIYGIFC